MAKTFEELTGIKVNLEVADLEAVWRQVLADQLTGGQYYDIFPAANNQTVAFAAPGFINDLNQFMSDPALARSRGQGRGLRPGPFRDLGPLQRRARLGALPLPLLALCGLTARALPTTRPSRPTSRRPTATPCRCRPTTWEQFRDLAEFFTRGKGETLAGETLESNFYGHDCGLQAPPHRLLRPRAHPARDGRRVCGFGPERRHRPGRHRRQGAAAHARPARVRAARPYRGDVGHGILRDVQRQRVHDLHLGRHDALSPRFPATARRLRAT